MCCETDAAGGKAKLAIVSMSAWQLRGPPMTFSLNGGIKTRGK